MGRRLGRVISIGCCDFENWVGPTWLNLDGVRACSPRPGDELVEARESTGAVETREGELEDDSGGDNEDENKRPGPRDVHHLARLEGGNGTYGVLTVIVCARATATAERRTPIANFISW